MNEVQIFKNDEFGEIRVVEKDGEVWFVAADVTKILGYNNNSKAIKDHVDEEDKHLCKYNESLGLSKFGAIIINESGLYSLILSSKLPTAKKFKRWVTSEVLPAIRKTGKYELVPVEVEESPAQEGQYLDLTQLELDQRIKIATIIASCRRERLALVAKVLSLDVEELKPVTAKRKRELATEDDIHDFIQSEWDRLPETIPVILLYTKYQNWCRLKQLIPVAKQVFGSVFMRYYPIKGVNVRFNMPDGTVKQGRAYRKIDNAPMEGGAEK